ncbi:hypothetical protein F383_06354 [Gossypium arboreum]|uniref:Uncharacterized protein n=1 Tax=Gossypium arboreum TaxID=29729 RepID=A0A0B0NQU8_GOSAR|nr:hypothetical protein F383_06354 [Gossypium arboreum]
MDVCKLLGKFTFRLFELTKHVNAYPYLFSCLIELDDS